MSKFNLGDLLKDAGVSESDTAQERIEYIPLDRIDPDPENFYSLDGLDELAANIETVGLQQPLRVRATPSVGGRYTVVSGHRRRAALMLIRYGGSDMFRDGVPCIVERGDVSREMQELRLIYANSSTRVLSSAELSRQAERVEELLYKLQEQGVAFPGRMRDHVAAAVNASKSKLARLHAIRNNLDSGLLPYYDNGDLTEDAAYALSRFPLNLQEAIARELAGGKRKKTPVASVLKEVLDRLDSLLKPIPCRAHAGGPECHHAEGRVLCSVFKQYSWDICPEGQCCMDCYKGKQGCSGACREAKDRFKLEKDVEAEKAAERKAADDAQFARRRADIERRCRELRPMVDAAGLKDEDKLWDNYEAATAGQVRAWATDGAGDQTFYGDGCVNPHFTDGLRQMAKRLKVPVSVLLGEKQEGLTQSAAPTAPAWRTGTPTKTAYYAAQLEFYGKPIASPRVLWWDEGIWYNAVGDDIRQHQIDKMIRVVGWWPLPEREAAE
jgi:ParB family chromosome partitioning protein